MSGIVAAANAVGGVSDEAALAIGLSVGLSVLVTTLLVYLLRAIGLWKTLDKAGEPGWVGFIPIAAEVFLIRSVQRPWWWILLMFVPIVSFVVWMVVCLDVAKAFGRSAVFAVFLLFFLPIIGFLILGFGSATYRRSERPATW